MEWIAIAGVLLGLFNSLNRSNNQDRDYQLRLLTLMLSNQNNQDNLLLIMLMSGMLGNANQPLDSMFNNPQYGYITPSQPDHIS